MSSLAAAGTDAQAQLGAGAAGTGASASQGTGVAMQDMIESIRATIDIAARGGATQARIALHPEDLGHISIRLSQTSAGLLARVSAETPAAAQALAQGRSELHQSLSSLGVSLLRLDINSFGQPQTGAREERFDGSAAGSGTSGSASTQEDAESPETASQTGVVNAPAIVGGELIDVLA